MFSRAGDFNQPLDNWDVSSVQNMEVMFFGANDFNQPINDWDVSNVTNMAGMFDMNSSMLNSVPGITSSTAAYGGVFDSDFNQPLNDWDVSNVTDMNGMFGDAVAFDQPLDNWDLASLEMADDMFIGSGLSCENYSLDLQAWGQ